MDEEKFVVLSKSDLQKLCAKTAEVAAKVAIDKVDAERKSVRKRVKDNRLHNTEMLLRNYNMFKISVENSVFTVRQLEDELSANEILNCMMDKDSDDITIKTIKESKVRTTIIIDHIDTMLALYQVYCERSPDDLDCRRYEVLMDRFIFQPSLSVKDIAIKYNISKESVYADLKIAKERVSALIFGVDGLSMR